MMTARTRRWLWIGLIALQVGLLKLELFTSYDTPQRQIALAVTNLIAVGLVLGFNRWLSKRSAQLSWITILLAFGAVWLDALGNFQHLYAGFWWWDRISHTVGGMAVAGGFIDFYQAWRKTGKLKVAWGQATWLGFLTGQFIGAMYEVTEWLGDMWFGTHRVVFIYDTPHDLFFNLLGGGLVVLLFRITQQNKLK